MRCAICEKGRGEDSRFCEDHEKMLAGLRDTGEWDAFYGRLCEAARRARSLPMKEIEQRFGVGSSTLYKWARNKKVWSRRGISQGKTGQQYQTIYFDPKEIGARYISEELAFLEVEGMRLEPLQQVARETGIAASKIHGWVSREECIRCKRLSVGGRLGGGKIVYVSRDDVLTRVGRYRRRAG